MQKVHSYSDRTWSRAFGGRAVWLAVLVLSGVELAAGNWPQWRGPSSRGVSQESGATHDVGRERQPRLARAARGARHLVAHRLGRSRHRHLANRRHADRRSRASPARARRTRARRARDPDWRPTSRDRSSRFRSGPHRDLARRRGVPAIGRPTAVGAQDARDRAVLRSSREAQPGDADTGNRRPARVHLVWQRPGRGARHDRADGLDASSRQGILTVPDAVGTRQLAHAPWRSRHLLVRSSQRFVPAGARRAHGEGAVEGRPRTRTRLSQHTARRDGAARRRARGQLVRAHRRLRSEDGRRSSGIPAASGRRRYRPRSSTTAGSS